MRSDILRHGREFARSADNFEYEVGESGIYFPRQKVIFGGVFTHDVRRNGELLGERQDSNIVVNEGLTHVLNILFRSGTQVATWYLAPFKGNYTPLATDTAANITANSTEATEYDEAARVEYNEAAPSSQVVTNSANRATFTFNAPITVYGAFLASASAKSAITGTLLSAGKFAAARAVVAADELLIRYDFTAADA